MRRPCCGVGEFRLLREGVVVQPFEQFGAVGGDHLHLREMDMRVDEARQEQVRPVVDDLARLAGLRRHLAIGSRRRRSCRRARRTAPSSSIA